MKDPFIGYKNLGIRFFYFFHNSRVWQTDRQTDGHFAHGQDHHA